MLLPLIRGPTRLTPSLHRAPTTCPRPLPPRRSRERPHPLRLLRRGHTAFRRPLPRRLSRERMRHPRCARGALPCPSFRFCLTFLANARTHSGCSEGAIRRSTVGCSCACPANACNIRGLLPRGRTMCPLPLPPRPSRERLRRHPLLRRGHTACRRRLRPGQTRVPHHSPTQGLGSHYAIPYVGAAAQAMNLPQLPAPAFGADVPFADPGMFTRFPGVPSVLPSYDIPGINTGGSAGTGALPVPGAGVPGVGDPSFYFLDGATPFGQRRGTDIGDAGDACIGGAPPV